MTSPAPAAPALRRSAVFRAVYWTVPSLFCLIVYFWGLRAWYQQDDFAWLGQRYAIANFHDLLHAIFAPSIHGTFRPLSERVFLLVAGSAFGADAFPARLLVMLTQIGNVLLLTSIGRRIFQSELAGFLLPILWVTNAAIAFPMAWSSSYMYILCGLCILTAFHYFLKYVETGESRYYKAQWAIFLFGFLVMETTIVYPAIVTVYAFLRARKYLMKAAAMFSGSVAFLIFHSLYVPKEHGTGTYSIHFDSALPHTLIAYWKWVVVPNDFLVLHGWETHPWMAQALLAVFTLAILAFAIAAALRRNYLPAFGLALFLILLAPVLPLKEHVSFYYLTLPSMGLAFVGAAAIAAAERSGAAMKILAGAVIGIFLLEQAPIAYKTCQWWFERSQRIRQVVMGVAAERQAMPNKTLVLTDVDLTVFAGVFWDRGFRAFGISDVYADPAERDELLKIANSPDIDAASYFLDAADFQRALLEHQASVFSVAGPLPIDVTPRFEAAARAAAPAWPQRVDVSIPLTDAYLHGSWYQVEGNHRWMGKQAGVLLAGPESGSAKLSVRGYCPNNALAAGPVTAHFAADNQPVGEVRLTREGEFTAEFPLPASTIKKASIEVTVEVDHTFRSPGDGRDLGLVFGSFEVR